MDSKNWETWHFCFTSPEKCLLLQFLERTKDLTTNKLQRYFCPKSCRCYFIVLAVLFLSPPRGYLKSLKCNQLSSGWGALRMEMFLWVSRPELLLRPQGISSCWSESRNMREGSLSQYVWSVMSVCKWDMFQSLNRIQYKMHYKVSISHTEATLVQL